MQESIPTQPQTRTAKFPGHWAWHRARQLEGTLSDDPQIGIWPVTFHRVLWGWGSPQFSESASDGGSWPEHNPAALDEMAKVGRIGLYYRVWDYTDVLKAHRRGHTVSAAFRVTEEWRNPSEGRLDFDQSRSKVVGGHSLEIRPTLCNMPRPKSWLGDAYFVGRNSWGEKWGNRGYYAMRYEFFDRELYEGWAVHPQTEFLRLAGNGIQQVKWDFDSKRDLRDRLYRICEFVDVDRDNRLAWGIAVLQRGELHVEELYVKPEARGKGYGSTIATELRKEANALNVPVRFWIPFGDVANRESLEAVQSFFGRHSIGFEPSLHPSAAFCAVYGGSLQAPKFALPPKPAYVFADAESPSVNWGTLQREFDVSDEFLNHAKSAFERHDDTLRRLA